jgi:predicted Zn-dependent protease
MPPRLLIRFSTLLLAAALANCAQNPVTGNPNLVLISESQEIAIGKREDGNVRKQYSGYDDDQLQHYVNEIGQRLAKVSHRPGLDYRFLVVDSPEVNAFALPGGYIYITRGIMAYLNSEAELAGVLGHEIGHVTARHSVQQLSAHTAANVGVSILQIFVPGAGGALGSNVINVLGSALLSGYGREHELEADRLGAEYLARTGYDPQAMVKVVGVLKNQELFDAEVAKAEGRQPRAYHGLFASHPDNDTRLQQVVGEAARFKQPTTRIGQEEFLRRSDHMIYADSPKQGVLRNHHFYHAELGLAVSFPAGWQARNRPQNVVATSPQGEAIIDVRAGGPAKGTPAEVLRRALKLSSDEEVTPAKVSGMPAAIANTTVGGRPTRAACVFHGKGAFLIAGQARSAEGFKQHENDIQATIMSFREMTDEDRALARPLKLRVITAAPKATFAALARRSPLGRFAEGHLRVINGQYPTGEPAAGQPLKIVE